LTGALMNIGGMAFEESLRFFKALVEANGQRLT
jgi:hypothetical protein